MPSNLPPSANQAALYGVNSENSNRKNADMWGKNCFNSSFPTALACYMRDNNKKAVYIHSSINNNDEIQIDNSEITVNDVFNSTLPNAELMFLFEQEYSPYSCYDYAGNELDGADLVIKTKTGEWLRPFQIKLTVIPDNNTSTKAESEWAPELVFRPADTALCTIGMFDEIKQRMGNEGIEKIKELLDSFCYRLNWDNLLENENKRKILIDKALNFMLLFQHLEKPYLLQPIWKTEGKSPNLSPDNALDIFVWSDYALILACIKKGCNSKTPTRGFRSIARFIRTMHDLSIRGNTKLRDIYRQMDFGKQTDKEIAFSGIETRQYITSSRRVKPLFPPEILAKIILNNGHKNLSPERRFDQSIYFTANKIFENQ